MSLAVRARVEGVDEFVGIDDHKRRCQVLVKDREGRVLTRRSIPRSREALGKLLGERNGKVRLAVFEAGPSYRPMHRWLREMVDEVVLANPGRLKVISDTVYKDDESDAEKLTDLLMLGVVPEAYACGDEAWARRKFLRQRVALVRMQTAVKNRIHALVDLRPEAAPPRPEATDLFGKMGMEWLRALEIPREERRLLDQLLEVYEHLHGQVLRTNAEVRVIVRSDERCRWLATVPGIGDFFAALIVAEVDDIRRFEKSKRFVSYTGLVPGRHRSDEVEHRGRIHKRGSRWLRWALVEAAVPATRSNLALKNLYDRVCRRKGPKAGPNMAKVAVARKLAEIVYRLLVEERPYEQR